MAKLKLFVAQVLSPVSYQTNIMVWSLGGSDAEAAGSTSKPVNTQELRYVPVTLHQLVSQGLPIKTSFATVVSEEACDKSQVTYILSEIPCSTQKSMNTLNHTNFKISVWNTRSIGSFSCFVGRGMFVRKYYYGTRGGGFVDMCCF